MELHEQYKRETGDDPQIEEDLLAEDYYQKPIRMTFFTDEYVWWLEEKIEKHRREVYR